MMPGTIKDDKSAIAHSSSVASPKYRAQFKSLESKPAVKPQAKYFASAFRRRPNDPADTYQFNLDRAFIRTTNSSFAVALLRRMEEGFLRKLVIGGLAALVSICSAGMVEAKCVNLDCVYSTCTTCRDACRFLDLDEFVNSMYTGSPKQFITGRHDGCWWYDSRKAGDYIDRKWYYYLDEGQYYYLDRTQYKLLGGLNYLLGHPCYPKLFERESEQAVGFANRRIIYTGWYDCCWRHLTISRSASLGNACTGCTGQMPAGNYVIWHSCFKPGDHIEKLRYGYLDKGRYYFLDEMQYKWIGGLAYGFETPHSGIWYTYGSPYSYDSLRKFNKEDITANISSIPEPASALLMTLGTTIITLFRRKR